MDIEGKHFPDEEDEHESKTGKKIGKIVFRILALCSAIVYVICFARIFSSCDSAILDDITFSDKAIEKYNQSPKDFKVYQINTRDFMEYYGTITLSDIFYAESVGELEIGIKYNTKITDAKKQNISIDSENALEDFPLVYRLKDKNGNEYEVCNRINDAKGSYKFERVSFSGLNIDFTNNYLNTNEYFASGEGIYFETDESEGGEKYVLEIYNPITKETKSFVIYDNNTSYREYEFKPGK